MNLHRSSVALGALLALALAPGLSAQDQEGLLVTGHVADAPRGSAVAQALVQIYLPGAERAFKETVTDADGRFRMEGVPPRRYQLFVRALGYRIVSYEVDIPDQQPIELRVELVPEALEMEPVVITSTSRRSLEREGFYERRRLQLGTILTREEILDRSGMRVSDIFHNMAGISVVADTDAAPNPTGVHRGVQVRFRGGCVPDLIVDGIETIPGIPLDDLLDIDNVEAIEIYRGGTAPSRFARSSCGTIVAWTRDPGADGVAFTWTRVFVAAGIVLISSVLMR